MEQHLIKFNRIEKIERTGQQKHGFGVRDSKGRVIGAMVSLFEGERTLVEHKVWIGCAQGPVKAAGHVYGFTPQATRDGESYGASQAARTFDSAKERDEAVATYFSKAQKRAAMYARWI